jgi:putative ABC transport system ATP-binding protein
MYICELKRVSRHYGSGPTLVRALEEVSLSVEPREFTVISGPSGSGKSTLLNLIGLLDTPTSGSVWIEDKDMTGLSSRELTRVRGRRIGFIFQSFNLIPVLSALENVELALDLPGMPGARGAAAEALASVGLGDLLHRRPNQLSGGQQQRVAIARALVKQPALVIADEPTANLDSANGAQVLDLMRRLNEEHGVTFLFSTHDARVMERARRIVHILDGRVERDEVAPGRAS